MGGAHAYATTEHVQRSAAARPPGQRTAGVKMVCPLRRRPDLTHEQFVEHWLTVHVPLALDHHPHMMRYVTNVVDQRLSPTAPTGTASPRSPSPAPTPAAVRLTRGRAHRARRHRPLHRPHVSVFGRGVRAEGVSHRWSAPLASRRPSARAAAPEFHTPAPGARAHWLTGPRTSSLPSHQLPVPHHVPQRLRRGGRGGRAAAPRL